MQQAVDMANKALTDETSTFYRIFIHYLNFKRQRMRREEQQLVASQNNGVQNYQAINQNREEDANNEEVKE